MTMVTNYDHPLCRRHFSPWAWRDQLWPTMTGRPRPTGALGPQSAA